MSLLKSISQVLANAVMVPADLVRDIATLGDEDKKGSYVVERGRKFGKAATEAGEIIVDASKVGGKKAIEVSKELGAGLGEVGKVIQNIADGNQKTEVRVSEEEKPPTKQEQQQLKALMPSMKDK